MGDYQYCSVLYCVPQFYTMICIYTSCSNARTLPARPSSFVCLSVCVQDYSKTRAWMKCCVSTDVGTWTNWLTFEPDLDHSPDPGTGFLPPISYVTLQCCLVCRISRPFPYQFVPNLHSVLISFWSSPTHVMNHNWSATKQRRHPQSVAEISCHSVLSGDRIRQCGTSSGSCHSVPVPCENGSVEPTVAEGG